MKSLFTEERLYGNLVEQEEKTPEQKKGGGVPKEDVIDVTTTQTQAVDEPKIVKIGGRTFKKTVTDGKVEWFETTSGTDVAFTDDITIKKSLEPAYVKLSGVTDPNTPKVDPVTKKTKVGPVTKGSEVDADAEDRKKVISAKEAAIQGYEEYKGGEPKDYKSNKSDYAAIYVGDDPDTAEKWYKKGQGLIGGQRRKQCKELMGKAVDPYTEIVDIDLQKDYFKTLAQKIGEEDVKDKIKFCISNFKNARFMKNDSNYKRFIKDFTTFGGKYVPEDTVEKEEEEESSGKDKVWTKVRNGVNIKHLKGPNFEIISKLPIFLKDGNGFKLLKSAQWDGYAAFTDVLLGRKGSPTLMIDGRVPFARVDNITVTDVKGRKGNRKGYITVTGKRPKK